MVSISTTTIFRSIHHHNRPPPPPPPPPGTSISAYTNRRGGGRRSSSMMIVQAIEFEGVTTAAASTNVGDISWQIVVGSLAGITPFVVAGIEFGKRIMAQRKCEICRGSGLVLEDDYYVRCPNCGGFLPWQSWKRFFTG